VNVELVQNEDFVYLGGVISQDVSCDKDTERGIGRAAGIVRNLHEVWKSKEMSKTTKVLLYQTLVQSVLLYNSETWTIKEEHKRKLNVFEMTVLRKICGVSRSDCRQNMDILKELLIDKDIVDVIQTRRLTYLGHVSTLSFSTNFTS